MAEHFLAVDVETPDKPEIARVAEHLGISADEAFAKCFRVWTVFDVHSVDGLIEGVGAAYLDDRARSPGITDALAAVGWLEISENGVRQTRFDFHQFDGSAKDRKHRARAAKSRDKQTLRKRIAETMSREDLQTLLSEMDAHAPCAESALQDRTGQNSDTTETKQQKPGPDRTGPEFDQGIDRLPNWPELEPFRDQRISPDKSQAIKGSVFAPLKRNHLGSDQTMRNWFAAQLASSSPVTGDTEAHLRLVLAAAKYADKMPDRSVRKTRVAVFTGIVSGHKWETVRGSLGV